jgi:hypothetical protein
MEFLCLTDLQEHNPQPMPAPHKFDHVICTTLPDSWIFIAMALFHWTKMKGDFADDLINRRHCSLHSLLLTKYAVTGCYQVHPGI